LAAWTIAVSVSSAILKSNDIELKAAAEGCPKITDTLSAFSNQSGGGKIIFGIDEQQNYTVCGVYDAADLQRRIKEILSFCVQPRSRTELETLFAGRMTIAYVMTEYIHPLVEGGRLRMTIPDKPKSKKQKYVKSE